MNLSRIQPIKYIFETSHNFYMVYKHIPNYFNFENLGSEKVSSEQMILKILTEIINIELELNKNGLVTNNLNTENYFIRLDSQNKKLKILLLNLSSVEKLSKNVVAKNKNFIENIVNLAEILFNDLQANRADTQCLLGNGNLTKKIIDQAKNNNIFDSKSKSRITHPILKFIQNKFKFNCSNKMSLLQKCKEDLQIMIDNMIKIESQINIFQSQDKKLKDETCCLNDSDYEINCEDLDSDEDNKRATPISKQMKSKQSIDNFSTNYTTTGNLSLFQDQENKKTHNIFFSDENNLTHKMLDCSTDFYENNSEKNKVYNFEEQADMMDIELENDYMETSDVWFDHPIQSKISALNNGIIASGIYSGIKSIQGIKHKNYEHEQSFRFDA